MYVIEKGNEPNMDIIYQAFADMYISAALDSDSPQEYLNIIIEVLKADIEQNNIQKK